MKVCFILVCLAICLNQRQAAGECHNPVMPACNASMDIGHNRYEWCKDRAASIMWHHNKYHKTCLKMFYLGCGGNANRFCTQQECRKICLGQTKN